MPRYVVMALVEVEVDAESEDVAVWEACVLLDTESCITTGEVVDVKQEDG